MSTKRPGFLKRLEWRLEWAAVLVVERLLSLAPIATLWKIGAALAWIIALLPSRRRTVRDNLRTALGPGASKEEIESTTREVFRHTAANLLCSFRTAYIPLDALHEITTLEDGDILNRALAGRKGVVVILSHMGNWELLAQVGNMFFPNAAISTMYRPLNNPHVDKIVADRRRVRGMTLFAKKDAIKGPTGFLREGGIVNILADQRAGRAGTLCPFFGRLMSATPLPSLLRKRTGCEVIGLSVRTTAPGRWTIKFHELPSDASSGFTPAHMTELLEVMYRESVPDVFWFQNLWRINKHRPLELRGKRGPIRLTAQRDQPLAPFPVLIRVPDDDDTFAETLPALRALAQSRPDIALHLLARQRLRPSAEASGVPHTFHSMESASLPAGIQVALVLSGHERDARELAHLFSGPLYSLPETAAQSVSPWCKVTVDPTLAPEEQWLAFVRHLGMHDPPLQLEYV